MPTTLLFSGDIHLGRRPQRLEHAELDPRQFAPTEAWARLIDTAIERRVDAVVLAGDVVDDERDRFEAYGHLERGIRRLLDEGIATVGVAGNHDGIALPLLADRLSGFTLLGRGGSWQRVELGSGEVPVDLLGWSFSERHHRESPLLSPGLQEAVEGRRADAALLGVLHCELGATTGSYAPVGRSELEQVDVDGWFLGHIHKPDDLTGARPLGYLGSLVGLGRGESGLHGPWLVEVSGRGQVQARKLVLGPLVWWSVEVDASDLPTDDTAADVLHASIQERFRVLREEEAALADGSVQVVACSVELTGRSAARAQIRDFVSTINPAELTFHFDGQAFVATKLHDATRPAADLHALAEQRTPLGVVAGLIQDLEANKSPSPALAEAVSRTMANYSRGKWLLDEEQWPSRADKEVLLAAANRLLDVLLTQQALQAGA